MVKGCLVKGVASRVLRLPLLGRSKRWMKIKTKERSLPWMRIKACRKRADTYIASSAIDPYLFPQMRDLGIHNDGSRSILRYVRCIAILQAMLSHSLRFGLVTCSGSSYSVQTQQEAICRYTSRLLEVPSCWNKFVIHPDNVEDFSLQSSLTIKLRRMLALAALSAYQARQITLGGYYRTTRY